MGRRRSGGKTSKAEQRRQRAEQLSRDQFQEFIGEAKGARQELDDASTAHATTFKRGDSIGVHLAAAKLYLQLDKMEDTKRADFLRAFDQYRDWSSWQDQPDIFETANDRDGDGAGDPREPAEGDESDEERQPGDGEEAEPLAAGSEVEETVTTLENDWGDDGNGESQPEMERAGFVFQEGRRAGVDGYAADQNPHAEASPLHAIWERGRATGEADPEGLTAGAADEDAAEATDEVAEAPRSRRRRRSGADHDGAAALH